MPIRDFIYFSKLTVGVVSTIYMWRHGAEICSMILNFVEKIFPMFSEYFYSKFTFRVRFFKDMDFRVYDIIKYRILHPKDSVELPEFSNVNIVTLAMERDPLYSQQLEMISAAITKEVLKELNIPVDDSDFEIINPHTVYSKAVRFLYVAVCFLTIYEINSITDRVLNLIFN